MRPAAPARSRIGRASCWASSQLAASAVARDAAAAMPSATIRASWNPCWRWPTAPGGRTANAALAWPRNSPGATARATTASVTHPATITSSWAANSRTARLDRGSCAGAHAVADATHGLHEARAPWVVAELAAQVGDVHLDQVVVADPLGPPHPLEQPLAAPHQPRVLGERVEQVELQAGQLDRLAGEADLPGGRVDQEVAEAPRGHRLLPAGTGPSTQGPDACHQLAGRERLGDVVVGAGRQADDLVGLLGPGGQHHHVGVAEGADPPTRLDAVQAGEHQVEHDQLGVVLARQLDRAFAVAAGGDLEPLALQVAGKQQIGRAS